MEVRGVFVVTLLQIIVVDRSAIQRFDRGAIHDNPTVIPRPIVNYGFREVASILSMSAMANTDEWEVWRVHSP